jgi:hypothetical protein
MAKDSTTRATSRTAAAHHVARWTAVGEGFELSSEMRKRQYTKKEPTR